MKPRVLLGVILLGVTATVQCQDVPQELPVIQLNIGIHLIWAQVAQTREQQRIGLMYRQTMAASEGMLFAFPETKQQCFWMKNTVLPLSVAWIADDGSVVNIQDMAPQTLDSHCSAKPVRFALEMHQGWFAQRGITAGARLQGWPFD